MRSASQFAAVVVLASAALSAAAQQQVASLARSHSPAGTVVARVNGVAVTQSELQQQIQTLFPYFSVHGGQIPPSAEKELRQKALDRAVLEELVYQEAQRRHLQIAPARVDERIQAARKKFASQAEFGRAITEQYGSEKEFRRRAVKAMMIETLWKQAVSAPAVPSEADLRNYYAQNKQRFVRPESVWLQTISILFAEKASAADRDKAKQKALELLPKAQAAKTADEFGALAEKYSMDDWRVMNGDHGWVHRGSMDEELNVAFTMKAGQVSALVAARNGFYILRVNGARPQAQMKFAEVRNTIKEALYRERETKLRARFEQTLRRQAKIEVL